MADEHYIPSFRTLGNVVARVHISRLPPHVRNAVLGLVKTSAFEEDDRHFLVTALDLAAGLGMSYENSLWLEVYMGGATSVLVPHIFKLFIVHAYLVTYMRVHTCRFLDPHVAYICHLSFVSKCGLMGLLAALAQWGFLIFFL